MLSTLIAGVVLLTLSLTAFGCVLLVRRLVASPAGATPLSPPSCPPVAIRRISRSGDAAGESPRAKSELTKQEAEDVLDWLEATGQPPGRVSITRAGLFKVDRN